MDLRLKVIFVVLGSLIGILTTSQLISDVPASSSFPLDQIQSKEELLSDLTNEQLALQSKILVLREREAEITDKNAFSQQKGILDKLAKLKTTVGLDVITAPGIEISLDDGFSKDRENEDSLSLFLVHAADLRDIVNLARAANASGIAINKQRVLVTTSIISVGNSVLINKVNVAPPYTISISGDVEQLVRRFEDTQPLFDLKQRVSENKIQMKIQEKPFVSIPVYNGSFQTKHIKDE